MRPEPRAALRVASLGVALASSLPAVAQPTPPLPSFGGAGEAAGPLTGQDSGGSTGTGTAAGLAGPRASAARIGTLGFPYSTAAPPADALARGWRLTPTLGLQAQATDNLNNTPSDRQSGLIGSLTPGLLIEVDTSRLKGVVNLAPTAQLYGSDSSQNRIDRTFNGQLLATLVPDAVFLDMRGAAGVQAAGGGFAPQGDTVVNRSNQVQTTSLQISPYYVHRFGSAATVQVGYAFQQVTQDIGGNGSGGLTPTGQTFFTNQDFIGNEFYAVARTGEDFGRFAMEGRAVSTDYSGSGGYDGAYRRIATVEGRYAITREVAALLEGGYQSALFNGVPVFRLDEPVWSVGTQITLSDDSRITLKYGHRDGVNSAFLQAVVALGVRTTLYANYSESLTTAGLTALDLLSTTTLDELGNPVDAATGAPVAQPFTNSFSGVQSGLMRVRGGSVTVSQIWPRDTLSFTVTRQEMTPISSAPGTISSAQTNTYGVLTWSHNLTERTSTVVSVQGGNFETPAEGSGSLFSASVSLVHQLTPTLSGQVQARTTIRDDAGATGRATQNVLLVGLRKTFEDW